MKTPDLHDLQKFSKKAVIYYDDARARLTKDSSVRKPEVAAAEEPRVRLLGCLCLDAGPATKELLCVRF